MSKKYVYSKEDRRLQMIAAKRAEEVYNSLVKRGEITNLDKIARTHHVLCGCGDPSCVFISTTKKEDLEKMKNMEQQG